MTRNRGFIPLLCLIVAFALRIDAHPSFPVSSIVRIESDGRVTIQVRHDALAYALNDTPTNISDEPMRRLLAGPRSELQKALDDARDRFLAQFELSADGQRVNIDITKRPDLAGIQAAEAAGLPVALPIMLDFVAQAHLPSSAHSVTMRFPEKMGDVIMTVERPGQEPFSMPLNAGERSQDFAINQSSDGTGGRAGHATPIGTANVSPAKATSSTLVKVIIVVVSAICGMLLLVGFARAMKTARKPSSP